MTKTKFSLKRTELVEIAKEYSTKKTLIMVISLALIMILPSIIGVIVASPAEMYGRYYNFLFDEALVELNNYVDYEDLKIVIQENEEGYVENIEILEENKLGYEAIEIVVSDITEISEESTEVFVEKPTFFITKNNIGYSDQNRVMWLPKEYFFASTFYEMNFTEVFEKIFLYNGYFTTYLPMIIFLIIAILTVIIFFSYVSMGIAFNFYLKKFKLSKKEVYKLLILASIVPAIISFFIGLLLPTIHIFLCQMMIVYNMHTTIKMEERKIKKAKKK